MQGSEPGCIGGSGIVPAAQAELSVMAGRKQVQGHSLMPLLYGERQLRRAARACMRRGSARGADGVSWADYRQGLPARIAALSASLREGTWRPGPLRTVQITTYAGKTFPAVIPTAEDRIVHRAMRGAIEPVLEALAFPGWVSGYRPGRNRVTALRDAMAHLNTGRTVVADVDVEQVTAATLARRRSSAGWPPTSLTAPSCPGSGRRCRCCPNRWCPARGCPRSCSTCGCRAWTRGWAAWRSSGSRTTTAPSPPARREARAAFGVISAALAAEGMRPHPGKSRIRADCQRRRPVPDRRMREGGPWTPTDGCA